MKKIFWILLWFWLIFGMVSASGCFHDTIHSVNKAGVITRWANIRNVACMYGSDLVWSALPVWTKVRIIWQTAWTKIVTPDWRIGWVWNNFVSETNDWANVPEYPANHNVKDYCDTTKLNRCPNPSPQWAEPTWYYRTAPIYTNSVPTVTPTTYTAPTSTVTTTSTVALSSAIKGSVDSLVDTLMDRLEDKMWDDSSAKKDFLNVLISKIAKTKVSYKVKPIITYLVEQLEEKATMFYIDSLLDI